MKARARKCRLLSNLEPLCHSSFDERRFQAQAHLRRFLELTYVVCSAGAPLPLHVRMLLASTRAIRWLRLPPVLLKQVSQVLMA